MEQLTLSGSRGELRYHGHTVALLRSWTRDKAVLDGRIGTKVAHLTFQPGALNAFWINFGKPTHVALPTKQGGGGPRRVYELVSCDVQAGKATFLAKVCAIEEPKR
jgi:hypothetical protein